MSAEKSRREKDAHIPAVLDLLYARSKPRNGGYTVVSRSRSSSRGSKKTVNRPGYRPVLIVLGIVLLLRLIHLAFAMRSPLSFQLSPDEDYYLQFALSVARGNGGSTDRFAFMDPAYGYIVGAL